MGEFVLKDPLPERLTEDGRRVFVAVLSLDELALCV